MRWPGAVELQRLSRVHLLIVRDGDQILALDMASTNGTAVGGREIRLTRLQESTRLTLAEALDVA